MVVKRDVRGWLIKGDFMDRINFLTARSTSSSVISAKAVGGNPIVKECRGALPIRSQIDKMLGPNQVVDNAWANTIEDSLVIGTQAMMAIDPFPLGSPFRERPLFRAGHSGFFT
jgi:hypothetical protein